MYGVLGKALPTCLFDIVWRPWQSASPLVYSTLYKRFPRVYWTPYGVLGKRFTFAYWTLYDILGKVLPTCLLDIIWPYLAKRFTLAYWTLYGVLVKALPTCLLDIVWRPWQSASHLSIGHRMMFCFNSDFLYILVLSKSSPDVCFWVNLTSLWDCFDMETALAVRRL